MPPGRHRSRRSPGDGRHRSRRSPGGGRRRSRRSPGALTGSPVGRLLPTQPVVVRRRLLAPPAPVRVVRRAGRPPRVVHLVGGGRPAPAPVTGRHVGSGPGGRRPSRRRCADARRLRHTTGRTWHGRRRDRGSGRRGHRRRGSGRRRVHRAEDGLVRADRPRRSHGTAGATRCSTHAPILPPHERTPAVRRPSPGATTRPARANAGFGRFSDTTSGRTPRSARVRCRGDRADLDDGR